MKIIISLTLPPHFSFPDRKGRETAFSGKDESARPIATVFGYKATQF